MKWFECNHCKELYENQDLFIVEILTVYLKRINQVVCSSCLSELEAAGLLYEEDKDDQELSQIIQAYKLKTGVDV